MNAKLTIHYFDRRGLQQGKTTIRPLKSNKELALLYYLAYTGKPASRTWLADFLWPNAPTKRGLANLRTVLSRLRQYVGEYLTITRQQVIFRRDLPCDLDVIHFDIALNMMRYHHSQEQAFTNSDITKIRQVLNRYEQGFLTDFEVPDSAEFEFWVGQERAYWQTQIMDLFGFVGEYLLVKGTHTEAEQVFSQALKVDPYEEAMHRNIMRLFAHKDRLAVALGYYETFADFLDQETGLRPTSETTALYQQLKTNTYDPAVWQDMKPQTAVMLTGSNYRAPCPYRGLTAFQEADAPFFFGREIYITHLLNAVTHNALTAVIGPSGSGKSSVAFAGLLPRLKQAHTNLFSIIAMRPDAHPFHNLAQAILDQVSPTATPATTAEVAQLALKLYQTPNALNQVIAQYFDNTKPARRLLLVVDQFEELYTLCPAPAKQRAFVDMLLSNTQGCQNPRWHTLLILRADFISLALAYRPLADVLQNNMLVLGPMNRVELQQAIEMPAQLQGVTFEAGLVNRLLNDVDNAPGYLPLLQFTLFLLWEQATPPNPVLSHATYEAMGTISGALVHYADQVHQNLSTDDQEYMKLIFTQLVTPNELTDDTRRIATHVELGDNAWMLVQHLADSRLLTTGRNAIGQDTVELAHETLIHSWGQFQTWREENRNFRLWQERLRQSLQQWQTLEEDENTLLRGRLLVEAEEWLTYATNRLTTTEQRFIQASITQRVEIRARELAQTQAFARKADLAQSLNLTSSARLAFNENNLELALSLALEANLIEKPPAAARLMLNEAAYAPGTRRILHGHQGSVQAVAIHPNSKTALSGSADHRLILWDLDTGKPIRHFVGHTDVIYAVAIHPNGKTALSGSADHRLTLWDLDTGKPIRHFAGHTAAIYTLAINPDGQTALSGGADHHLCHWDLTTGVRLQRITGAMNIPDPNIIKDQRQHYGPIHDVVFIGNKRQAITVSEDRYFILWDLETGHSLNWSYSDAGLLCISLLPNEKTAVLGTLDGRLIIYDLDRWRITSQILGHQGRIMALALAPNGRQILSASADHQLRWWDLKKSISHLA